MAKKSFEILKPPVEEYREMFEALCRTLGKTATESHPDIRNQIDHTLDLYGADYSERIQETKVQLGCLALEAV